MVTIFQLLKILHLTLTPLPQPFYFPPFLPRLTFINSNVGVKASITANVIDALSTGRPRPVISREAYFIQDNTYAFYSKTSLTGFVHVHAHSHP